MGLKKFRFKKVWVPKNCGQKIGVQKNWDPKNLWSKEICDQKKFVVQKDMEANQIWGPKNLV